MPMEAGLPPNPINLMSEWLRERKAKFNEKGMMVEWNELSILFAATLAGGPATIAGSDFATNFNPDFAMVGPRTARYTMAGAFVDPQPQSR